MHTSRWAARRGDEPLPQGLTCSELAMPSALGSPNKQSLAGRHAVGTYCYRRS